jgi:hypothetical protein
MTISKAWPMSRVLAIRDAVTSTPTIDRPDGYREWSWQFGVVYTQTTKRQALCVGCHRIISTNTPALYVIFTETRGGGWTPERRYLHVNCTEATS